MVLFPWAIIDKHASLRSRYLLTRRMNWRFYRNFHAVLKIARVERTWKVGEVVVSNLAKGKTNEAWRILRNWYRAVEGKAGKPCYHWME